MSRLRPSIALLIAILSTCPAVASAQGRWDFVIGRFDGRERGNAGEGAFATFDRFRGEERGSLRGSPRLSAIWSGQIQFTIQPLPDYPFRVTGKRSFWALGVGRAYRFAAGGLPVRPYLELGPGVSLYRSVDITRFTNVNTGEVGVINETRWLMGPALDLVAGMEIPAGHRGPRLQVRGGYHAGWLLGAEAVGATPTGVWHVWELGLGAGFPF